METRKGFVTPLSQKLHMFTNILNVNRIEARSHIQAPHVKEKNRIAVSIFKGKATENLGSSKIPLDYWEKLHTFEYM